jgi:hypothetical protein
VERKQTKVAAVGVANKTARIAWAVMMPAADRLRDADQS